MEITRETIGTSIGHSEQRSMPVDAYTLKAGKRFAITVWTYGATLIEVHVPDRDGQLGNVVLRLPDLRAYESRTSNAYMGATIGRYARCIAGSHLKIDGVHFPLDPNCGPHHLHGGPIGFDRHVWSAQAERSGGQLVLALCLERPDGDQGYPGKLSAETMYRLEEGRLILEHQAVSTTSTVVDITNHSYWNLAGSGTINRHRLRLNARQVLQVDDDLIPVGLPTSVSGTRFDYLSSKPIAQNHLDHCFVLDDPDWAAQLSDPASGRVMRVITDQPGLQVYTGDGLRQARTGICLQTGSWPDSPNRPEYPSSRLDPGKVYHHETVHEFSAG